MKSELSAIVSALLTFSGAIAAEYYPDTDLDNPNKYNDGVVLVHADGHPARKDEENKIGLNDTIVVRVRNIDGWLIRRLQNDQISGEPEMTKLQRTNYLKLIEMKGSDSVASYLAKHDPEMPGVPGGPEKIPKEQYQQFRDAKNAFDDLLQYTKANLYLVINDSRLTECKTPIHDPGVLNKETKAAKDTTVYEFPFHLRRCHKDLAEWSKLYRGTTAKVDARINLGVDFDGKPFTLNSAIHPMADKKVQRVHLELYSPLWLAFVVLTMGVFGYFLFELGRKSDLLRDRDLRIRADGKAQFSLARFQLALWLYLAVGAFLVIWLVTDRLDTLNPTVLTLLGISSATLLASKLANTFTLTDGQVPADPSRLARFGKGVAVLKQTLSEHRTLLGAEATRLFSELRNIAPAAAGGESTPQPDPNAGAPADPTSPVAAPVLSEEDKKAREAQARDYEYRIEQIDSDLAYLEYGRIGRFLLDLLSENGRLSLHRLQILVWTLVLGFVFVYRVTRELAMPEFSETLLGLMGISSATYIALKVPELKKIEQQSNAALKDP